MQNRQMTFGAIGSIVCAVCCFTPVLVIILGTLGAVAIIPWLDYVLLPGLLFFVCLTAYGWIHNHKHERHN